MLFFLARRPPPVPARFHEQYKCIFERLGMERLTFDDLIYEVRHAGGADRRRVDFTDILANLVPFPRGHALVFAAPCAVP